MGGLVGASSRDSDGGRVHLNWAVVVQRLLCLAVQQGLHVLAEKQQQHNDRQQEQAEGWVLGATRGNTSPMEYHQRALGKHGAQGMTTHLSISMSQRFMGEFF
jgi:hypothetical protein